MKKNLALLIFSVFIGFGSFAQAKIPSKNQQIVNAITKYGPEISSTYQKAVCTELVIKILEKFTALNKTDKSRIRIITDKDIPTLLKQGSPIPKGVYYALTARGIGTAVAPELVIQGDFVQFWTETWRHCGVIKSIDLKANTMELYSSFPSTNGYGIQTFTIPKYCYFVRLK